MAWAPWLLLLLGSASVLSAAPSDVMEGECGVPTLVENAQIAEGSNSEKLRYSCMKNYKRKAGTSNLILCKQDKHTKEYQWTNSNLICIRDPLLPPSTTPEKTSRGEATPSTPAAPKTAATTSLETGSPPADRPTTTMAPRSIVGLGQVTSPGPVTQSSTRPRETTITTTPPVLQTRTSETLKAGNRSTVAPPKTSSPWKLTDSPAIRVGFPLLVLSVILLAFLLWRLCFWKQTGSQRPGDLPPSEETPMVLMASEDNGQASDPGDFSSRCEGDRVLPSPSATSTG
nr:PREDICTED: interleukin-15 receptor subunit alpha isoform X2 [Anolis carolinensis]|eukprot:XP_008108494.1 PREDICTED: interleukin-15 receptor subunit alpha isoform X2 [Anolis carolinensis]